MKIVYLITDMLYFFLQGIFSGGAYRTGEYTSGRRRYLSRQSFKQLGPAAFSGIFVAPGQLYGKKRII